MDKWKNMTKLQKGILSGIVACLLIGGGIFVIVQQLMEPQDFQPSVNLKYEMNSGVIVELDLNSEEQLLAAACMIPVTPTTVTGLPDFKPLVFRERGQPLATDIATSEPDLRERVELNKLGNSKEEMSRGVANKYWATVNTIIVVSTYDEALLVAPLAKLTNSPIIYDSSKVGDFVESRKVENMILVGGASDHDDLKRGVGIRRLADRDAVWDYYMEEATARGVTVDYIVVINPYDIQFSNDSYWTPGMSLPSAYLAASHDALVVLNDYTVEHNWTCLLGYGTGDAGSGERGADEDIANDTEEMRIQKLVNAKAILADNDIDYAYSYLTSRGHLAKYVAIGGGPGAIPHLYIKSPIWYEGVKQDAKGEEYVASDHYYGDTDLRLTADEYGEYTLGNNYGHMRSELYVQEMAVGRIVASSMQDACGLVARSLGYWKSYYNQNVLTDQTVWWRQTTVVTSLVTGTADNNVANQQVALFAQNNMLTKKIDPRNAPIQWATGEDTVKLSMETSNAIIYDGHGYPDGWYYMWSSTSDKEADWDRIGAEDIRGSDLHAAPVFGACCLSSALDWPTVWAGGSKEAEFTPHNSMALAFIHAGSSGYVGATEESWGAFFFGLFDGTPDQYGAGDFDMATMYYRHLLEDGMTNGEALNAAKTSFYEVDWLKEGERPFARVCVLETVLYGDPAAPWAYPGES